MAEALGNRPITSYSSSDAAAVRDHLFGKGLSLGSVKRIFGSVRSIINLAMRQHGIEGSNAFARTYMPDRDDSQDRQPVPQDKLIILQKPVRKLMMRCVGCWLLSAIPVCASVRLQVCIETISSLMDTLHQPHSPSVASSEDQEQCKAYPTSGDGSMDSIKAATA